MTDLLGPANAPFAVTTRPADTRVFGTNDSFFQDCSSSSADDGTDIQAAFLNGILGQLRRAIRGSGITENNADDDMLLKAIKRLAFKGPVQQAYTTAGTYNFTVPAGVQFLDVEVWGGGGGGGSAAQNAIGAGGAPGAGYARKLCAVTPGQVITVTVGAAGAGGVSGGNGGNGGSSSFGSFCSVPGSNGASGNGSTFQFGTTGVGGDINLTGGGGGVGLNNPSSGLGIGGYGGISPLTGGGSSMSGTNGYTPGPGSYGAGGGGGGGVANANQGGPGIAGAVLIRY